MERDLWKRMVAALKALPRRRGRNCVYHNGQILAVIFWAALHDRPISWACRRSNWPIQAWRRALPDQSTMSRRLRDPGVEEDIAFVLDRLQRAWPAGRILFTDGKPFALRDQTGDADARVGRATGHYAPGYKLHIVIDDAHQVQGWRIYAMNKAESVVSRAIVEQMPATQARLLIADASYDSNPFYNSAKARGIRLIAPRRRPHGGLAHGRQQHPDRLKSIRLTEQSNGPWWPRLRKMRWTIERYFAGMVSSGTGVSHLPTWIRRIHRVRAWIGAKLVINAARIAHRHHLHA